MLGAQYAMTGGLVTYAAMKRGGFKMTPFGVAKVPQYAGILFSSYIAFQLGMSVGRGSIGDAAQFNYLLRNKSGIVSGNKSWDAEK